MQEKNYEIVIRPLLGLKIFIWVVIIISCSILIYAGLDLWSIYSRTGQIENVYKNAEGIILILFGIIFSLESVTCQVTATKDKLIYLSIFRKKIIQYNEIIEIRKVLFESSLLGILIIFKLNGRINIPRALFKKSQIENLALFLAETKT